MRQAWKSQPGSPFQIAPLPAPARPSRQQHPEARGWRYGTAGHTCDVHQRASKPVEGHACEALAGLGALKAGHDQIAQLANGLRKRPLLRELDLERVLNRQKKISGILANQLPGIAWGAVNASSTEDRDDVLRHSLKLYQHVLPAITVLPERDTKNLESRAPRDFLRHHVNPAAPKPVYLVE
jgi:hypothetical protein